MIEIVYRRLANAMRQLKSEMAANGERLPDCEFVVKVTDGDVDIAEPSAEKAAAPAPEAAPAKPQRRPSGD